VPSVRISQSEFDVASGFVTASQRRVPSGENRSPTRIPEMVMTLCASLPSALAKYKSEASTNASRRPSGDQVAA
jgi:hypothetical protein